LSDNESKRYYTADPHDVREVLDHKKDWAKISQKKQGSEEWTSAGYIGWAKSGRTLTIMVSDKPPPTKT